MTTFHLIVDSVLIAALALNTYQTWRARTVDARLDAIEKFLRIARTPP